MGCETLRAPIPIASEWIVCRDQCGEMKTGRLFGGCWFDSWSWDRVGVAWERTGACLAVGAGSFLYCLYYLADFLLRWQSWGPISYYLVC